ncbi:MAG: thioesterase family protein [Actinobacteria bacterium]|nr:thioesterase family protein [Actinomycetota bacterium]
MPDALFHRDGDLFLPTEAARSPWSERALHGGPPGALIARAIEAMEGDRWWVVRLTIDIMAEIPVVPLRVETGLERSGRRVQLVEGRVTDTGGATLMRAFAWRVRRTGPLPLPPPVDPPPPTPPLPDTLPPYELRFRNYADFYGDGVEKRLVAGDVARPGRATVWFRLRVPVLPGETPTPLQTLMAVVDSANGISWALPFEEWLFPNTDLGVYLAREPEGEWIALDAASYLDPGGRGISDTALFDTKGFVGRANQALFLDQR